MLKTLLLIGMGSFAGGTLRYVVSHYIQNNVAHVFPFATLVVNLLGCFLIGLIYGMLDHGHLMNGSLRLFLTVGFCGGFTTFSTFINENFQLIKSTDFLYLGSYLTISLVGGMLMLYLGLSLIRLF